MLSKTAPKIEGYYAPLGPYSHVVTANGFIFLSAQTPLRPDGSSKDFVGSDVKEQTRQVISNVKLLLEKAGSSLDDVVKVTVYLANPRDSGAMNEIYKAFFTKDPPARAIARLGLEPPGLLVAMDVIAVQGK